MVIHILGIDGYIYNVFSLLLGSEGGYYLLLFVGEQVDLLGTEHDLKLVLLRDFPLYFQGDPRIVLDGELLLA